VKRQLAERGLRAPLPVVPVPLPRSAPLTQGATSFDWDDNVMFTPTEVVLFHRLTGEERRVETGLWARIRDQVGKPGAWADYEVRVDDRTGSFRDSHDLADPDIFCRDVADALARPPSAWQGPSFAEFARCLSRPQTAATTSIVTARGHSPDSILAALRLLKERGFIAHLPRRENIFPVDYPPLRAELGGRSGQPTPSKLAVFFRLLDELQLRPFALTAKKVVTADGDGRSTLHLWHYSDDDPHTFCAALAELGREVASGRWSNVKIVLRFTGAIADPATAREMVLRRDGTPRPATAAELAELGRPARAG
jgi:hypothetical protein